MSSNIDKTHDDTAGPPTAFDLRTAGRGALGPETTTAVVGFEIGRLLNELRFHLVQAWVCTERHREHVVRIALELGRVARYLRRTATSRERIQNEVRTTVDRLLESSREEWHAESISHLIDVHNNPSTIVPPDEEVQAEEVRRSARESFWNRVHSEIERLRERLTRNLDEGVRLALHLGELIDQWVRRKDVQDFLLTESDDAIKKVMRIRIPRHERNYIINELTPGSVPGDPRWAGDVMQIARELSVEDAIPQELLSSLAEATGDEVLTLLESLSEKVHLALSAGGRKEKDAEVETGALNSTGDGEIAQQNRRSDERGRYAYELCNDIDTHYETLLEKFGVRVKEENWLKVRTANGLKHIAKRYAKSRNLPALKSRQNR
jgi:hypothetical protein